MKHRGKFSESERIEREIEREYYLQAQGRCIDIMKIPAFFGRARAAVNQGVSVKDAVAEAVLALTEPAGHA